MFPSMPRPGSVSRIFTLSTIQLPPAAMPMRSGFPIFIRSSSTSMVEPVLHRP